jgi:hypothetical protein
MTETAHAHRRGPTSSAQHRHRRCCHPRTARPSADCASRAIAARSGSLGPRNAPSPPSLFLGKHRRDRGENLSPGCSCASQQHRDNRTGDAPGKSQPGKGRAHLSRSCACIGSPCLRPCVHGAPIGGGGGGGGSSCSCWSSESELSSRPESLDDDGDSGRRAGAGGRAAGPAPRPVPELAAAAAAAVVVAPSSLSSPAYLSSPALAAAAAAVVVAPSSSALQARRRRAVRASAAAASYWRAVHAGPEARRPNARAGTTHRRRRGG